VQEYQRFFNKHYNLVARLEERVTKHGNSSMTLTEEEMKMGLMDDEGINIMGLFSLAKRNPFLNSSRPVPEGKTQVNSKDQLSDEARV